MKSNCSTYPQVFSLTKQILKNLYYYEIIFIYKGKYLILAVLTSDAYFPTYDCQI